MHVSRRSAFGIMATGAVAVGLPAACSTARAQQGVRTARPATPRIAALSDEQLTAEQKAIAAPIPRLRNIDRTLLNAPAAAKALLPWGEYVLGRGNDLAPRQREIVILRTVFLCRAGYAWTQHVAIGLRNGLTSDEIARVKAGAVGWSASDALLIRASDELHADQCLSDAVWRSLRDELTEKQCMDVVFTASQYTQISMMLNSFGVQLESGDPFDPDLR